VIQHSPTSNKSIENRLVSATWGNLVGNVAEAVLAARKNILEWVTDRSDEALPAEAFSGAAFSLALGHCDVLSDGGIWAMRFDTVDDAVREELGVERRWRTEAVVAEINGSAIFTTRLSVVTATSGIPFFRSAPAVVRELAIKPGIIFDGLSAVDEIASNAHQLIAFLTRNDRRPVIAVADNEDGSESIANRILKDRFVGFAHVIRVCPDVAWAITKSLGREWSVFNGAIRLFMPGMNPDTENYRKHPIWLKGSQPADRQGWSAFRNRLLDRLLAISSARADLDDLAPSFNAINNHLRAVQLAEASRAATAAAASLDQATTLEGKVLAQATQIEALTAEVDLYRDQTESVKSQVLEVSQDRDLAYEINRDLEQELDRLKSQIFSVNARNRNLEAKLSESGSSDSTEFAPLNSYDDLEEWAEKYFAGRLVVLPKAVRACKKGEYEDLDRISNCLALLARQYVDMRRGLDEGGTRYREKCEELRVEISSVGDALKNHRYREQFIAPYLRATIELDMHLAPAVGTSERGSWDPKRTFRIYFAWDDEQEVVLLGSLPGHLTTSLTH
jgi:hypothetical protein